MYRFNRRIWEYLQPLLRFFGRILFLLNNSDFLFYNLYCQQESNRTTHGCLERRNPTDIGLQWLHHIFEWLFQVSKVYKSKAIQKAMVGQHPLFLSRWKPGVSRTFWSQKTFFFIIKAKDWKCKYEGTKAIKPFCKQDEQAHQPKRYSVSDVVQYLGVYALPGPKVTPPTPCVVVAPGSVAKEFLATH